MICSLSIIFTSSEFFFPIQFPLLVQQVAGCLGTTAFFSISYSKLLQLFKVQWSSSQLVAGYNS